MMSGYIRCPRPPLMLPLIKAHAYGNDFLYVPVRSVEGRDLPALARQLCARHRGAGADGLIVYTLTPLGARMTLANADGSHAELSGNGLRALAAIVVRGRATGSPATPGTEVVVETDAGLRALTLVEQNGSRYTFRASMGTPAGLREQTLTVAGEQIRASVCSIGNPQCVLLGPLPDDERFARIAPALERHPEFPQGTNVEFVEIEASDRVRIRIWERGVGPTESSGTGACASAVAAIAHGGAARVVEVIAPGGTQRVEWNELGVFLTGWAELVWEGTWLADV
jgi:diaminopimelate epimerase